MLFPVIVKKLKTMEVSIFDYKTTNFQVLNKKSESSLKKQYNESDK